MVQFITEIGFCSGVKGAIRKRKEYSKGKNIFLLHPLRHNKIENDKIRNDFHAAILDKDILSSTFPNNSLLVFSAHGAEKGKMEQATKKGIPFIETTCPIIESRLKSFKAVYKNQKLFYYGKEEHPETISFLENHPEAIFLCKESFSSLADGNKSNALLFTQSTLSREQTNEAIFFLEEKNYIIEYISNPCPVFNNRLEEALSFLSSKKDFYFAVLGDQTSSNTQALFSGIHERHKDCKGFIFSSVQDIPQKENRQEKDWYLACSTSISTESARNIYKALLFETF